MDVSQANRVQVIQMGPSIQPIVRRHVIEASSCVPIFCTPHEDTHLLFTYSQKICDESFRETMVLKMMVVEETSATMIQTGLSYNQSERISMKEFLKRENVRGVCFAWGEREGDPKGFQFKHKRLTPIFHAFYVSSKTGKMLDCVHSSRCHSGTFRERHFWVPEDGTQVTGIVCAPLDAYQNKVSRLTYTFGLREGEASWKYVTQEIPFTPTRWVHLNELFGTDFKSSSIYTYSVSGPKGKGWLLTRTPYDFNFHHL